MHILEVALLQITCQQLGIDLWLIASWWFAAG
jgi:hypothetical protein